MANNYALIERTLREIRDLLVREPNNGTDKKGFNNMGRIERTLREIRDEIESGSGGGGGGLPEGGEDGYILTKHKTEGGYGEGTPIEEDLENPGKDKFYSTMYFLPRDIGYDEITQIFDAFSDYEGDFIYRARATNVTVEMLIDTIHIVFGDNIETKIPDLDIYKADDDSVEETFYVYSNYELDNETATVEGREGYTVTVNKGWNAVDEINHITKIITAHSISENPITIFQDLEKSQDSDTPESPDRSILTPIISAGVPFPVIDPVESESWDDYEGKLIPEGGEVGAILRKTETGSEWAFQELVDKPITVVANFSGDPDATRMDIYVVARDTVYKDSFFRYNGEIQTREYYHVVEIYTYEPEFSDPDNVVSKLCPKGPEGKETIFTSNYGVINLSEAKSYKPLGLFMGPSIITIGKPIEVE